MTARSPSGPTSGYGPRRRLTSLVAAEKQQNSDVNNREREKWGGVAAECVRLESIATRLALAAGDFGPGPRSRFGGVPGVSSLSILLHESVAPALPSQPGNKFEYVSQLTDTRREQALLKMEAGW